MKVWTAEHDEQHDEPTGTVIDGIVEDVDPPVEEAAVVHQPPPPPPTDHHHVNRRLEHLLSALEQSGSISSEARHAIRHIP